MKKDSQNQLNKDERLLLTGLLNEKVADLSIEYNPKILSIQKKLKLFPRKERWVMCGRMYVTVLEKKGAPMKWIGPIVKCCEKVERPYSDHNLLKQGKLK